MGAGGESPALAPRWARAGRGSAARVLTQVREGCLLARVCVTAPADSSQLCPSGGSCCARGALGRQRRACPPGPRGVRPAWGRERVALPSICWDEENGFGGMSGASVSHRLVQLILGLGACSALVTCVLTFGTLGPVSQRAWSFLVEDVDEAFTSSRRV